MRGSHYAGFIECKCLAALGPVVSEYLRKDFNSAVLTPKFMYFRAQ